MVPIKRRKKMKKKRGQNEGSISKRRKDGLIPAQISVNGKRITKYFRTVSEANAWRIDSLSKVQKGLFVVETNLTLSEFFDQWLINSRRRVKPKTLIQYTQIIDQHIRPYLGNFKLTELRPNLIQQLYTLK